jgi:chemotaxis protein methyltransferase CheR
MNTPLSTVDEPLPVLTLPDSWAVTPVPAVPAFQELKNLVQEKRYDEALPLLDLLLGHIPGHQEAMLLKSHVLLNRKQFDAAVSAANDVLESESWSIDAFILLGLAARWSGQPEEALRWFKQAAYACHTCWPAHYYLADHYRLTGATEQARREYRIVLQLLSSNPEDTGIKVVPVGLPVAEIRLLSEHQLTKLGSC